MNLEKIIGDLPEKFRRARVPAAVREEAKKRVLDALGCFMGSFSSRPVRLLRERLAYPSDGPVSLWGTSRTASMESAVLANGAAVRALDFNDTYLSKEPCHPSDLLSSLWAACDLSGRSRQGRLLIDGLILAYECLGRLCDAQSLRKRGWDHVTYLPAASAVGCSLILNLSKEQTSHAVALSLVGNTALRQTRIGHISDWKAACAAYAARAGLMGAVLAKSGFTGPDRIFTGQHGFLRQVAGKLNFSLRDWGKRWIVLESHTKFFPAEHHSQSAIEAAIRLHSLVKGQRIKKVRIHTFDVSYDIIGSEPEKWAPRTRETGDHSLPYLVAAALLDGTVSLSQFDRKRYADPDVRRLMKKTEVRSAAAYSRLYPRKLPNRVTVALTAGKTVQQEILLPRGYAGNPMSWAEVEEKAERLAQRSPFQVNVIALSERIKCLEDVDTVSKIFARLQKVK